MRYNWFAGAMAESADAADLKSAGGNTLWVQPPLAPLFQTKPCAKTRNRLLIHLNIIPLLPPNTKTYC
jgi:hypothetical protein